MRVLMTGGTGHIGKSTAEWLIQEGWEVRIIDIAADVEISGAECIACDILDFDHLLTQMEGCDAVIHLAAFRGPSLAPAPDLFRVNAAGTFNVYEAAARSGIKRVVQASSINALGAFYNHGDLHAAYFPVDEDHPTHTTDPYSFSKEMVEDIGAYYWRREGISGAAFRFPGVYTRGMIQSESSQQRRAQAREMLDDLLKQPESVQRERIAEAQRRTLELRAQRPLEYGAPAINFRAVAQDDPLVGMYFGERFNYWAFIDERDAAQALVKGVTADYDGAHPLFVNDRVNSLLYDSRALIRLFFPDVTRIDPRLSDADSLISIDRARQLIGFEPEFSLDSI